MKKERDEAIKRRDHARTEHEQVSKSRKRALESNELGRREGINANRRIHEMHLIIKRASPREATRELPVRRVHALRAAPPPTKQERGPGLTSPVLPPVSWRYPAGRMHAGPTPRAWLDFPRRA